MSQVTCPNCEAVQVAPSGSRTWAACIACGAMIFRPAEGPRVLVAHESDALAEQIGSVLVTAGFSPLRAADGNQALRFLDKAVPPAAVVDVGLGPVMAFEVIEHTRKNPSLSDTKVVLVASVYNKTAYKRRPTKLYGADDYVEQHHIPDMLPSKLCKLLDIDPAGVAALGLEPDSPENAAIREASPVRADLAGAERVRAAAHSVVADIALYHQAEIESVVQGAGAEQFAQALEEGRRVLDQIAPRSEWPSADPVGDAFEALVEEMRRGSR